MFAAICVVAKDLKDWESMCFGLVVLLGSEFVENLKVVRVRLYL